MLLDNLPPDHTLGIKFIVYTALLNITLDLKNSNATELF
jgi:hypothetical protein